MTFNRSKVLISSITSAILKERDYFKVGENYEGSGTTITTPPTFTSGGYTYSVPEGDYTNNNLVLGNISIGGNLPITNIVTTGSPLFNSRYVISSTGEVKVIGSLDYDYVGGRSLSASLAISNSLGTNNVNITINVTDVANSITITPGQIFIYDLINHSNNSWQVDFTNDLPDVVSSNIFSINGPLRDRDYVYRMFFDDLGVLIYKPYGNWQPGPTEATYEFILHPTRASPKVYITTTDGIDYGNIVIEDSTFGVTLSNGPNSSTESITIETIMDKPYLPYDWSGQLLHISYEDIAIHFPDIVQNIIVGSIVWRIPLVNEQGGVRSISAAIGGPNENRGSLYNLSNYMSFNINGDLVIIKSPDFRFIQNNSSIPMVIHNIQLDGDIVYFGSLSNGKHILSPYYPISAINIPNMLPDISYLEGNTIPTYWDLDDQYNLDGNGIPNFSYSDFNISNFASQSYPLGLGSMTLKIADWQIDPDLPILPGEYVMAIDISNNNSSGTPNIDFSFKVNEGDSVVVNHESFSGTGFQYRTVIISNTINYIRCEVGRVGLRVNKLWLRKKTANWFN